MGSGTSRHTLVPNVPFAEAGQTVVALFGLQNPGKAKLLGQDRVALLLIGHCLYALVMAKSFLTLSKVPALRQQTKGTSQSDQPAGALKKTPTAELVGAWATLTSLSLMHSTCSLLLTQPCSISDIFHAYTPEQDTLLRLTLHTMSP